MTDRAMLCEVLLEHLLDWVPGPKTATGQIVLKSALPGERAEKKITCPACKGSKQRRIRGMVQDCDTCEPTKAGRPSGKILVDPQTGKKPSTMSEPERFGGAERAKWRSLVDADLDRIGALLAEQEGTEATDTLTSALSKQQKAWAGYSFADTARALEVLRDGTRNQQLAYSLLMRTRVYREFPEQEDHPVVRQAIVEALEMLALEMPDRIAVPGRLLPDRAELAKRKAEKDSLWHGKHQTHEARRAQRMAEIKERLASGEGSASVASSYALSQRRVQQMRRETAA